MNSGVQRVWFVMLDGTEEIANLVTPEVPYVGMAVKFSRECVYEITDAVYCTSTSVIPYNEAISNTDKRYAKYVRDEGEPHTGRVMYFVSVKKRVKNED